MNKINILIFLTIFISIYFGMHYYIYTRVSSGLNLGDSARKILRLSFLSLALLFVVAEVTVRHPMPKIFNIFSWIGMIWLGVVSIGIFLFFINDISRIFVHSPNYRYLSTVCVISLTILLSTVSVINVLLLKPVLKEIIIKTDKAILPNGFTIIQLSDIHLNLFYPENNLREIVEITNSCCPDLVLITGDLIDADLTKKPVFFEILKQLKSTYGVYAVTGNHEFYAGMPRFIETAENSNIKVIRNGSININNEFVLAGIDDNAAKRFEKSGIDIEKILRDCDKDKFIILMSHQPDIFDKAVELGIDLQLSGHTHRGQIPPMDIIVSLIFKYPYGLYKKDSSYLYTTSGTGYWGPPMRLTSRCEIVKINLVN